MKFEKELSERDDKILTYVRQKNELLELLNTQKEQLQRQYEVQLSKQTELYQSLKHQSQEEIYNTKILLREQYNAAFEEKEQKLRLQLEQDLTKIVTQETNQLQLINKQLTCEYEKKLEQETNQLQLINKQLTCEYEKKLEQETSILRREIITQQTHISQLNQNIADCKLQKSSLDNINDTLKPIVRFYSSKSTEEKGTAGEKFIYNILTTNDRYTDAVVEDKSGVAKRGDIYFKWKQMRCLIEVKNKISLRREDIEKFERDIDVSRTSSDNINCALFISLQTDVFPGHHRNLVQFDYYNNILVSYLYLSSINDLHYVICCMDKLIMSITTNDEQTSKLIKHFTNYYSYLNSTRAVYEKHITAKNKEIMQYTKLIKDLDNVVKNITNDYLTFVKCSDVSGESFSDDETETVTDVVENQPLEKTETKTSDTEKKVYKLSTDSIKKYILQLVNSHKLSIKTYKIDKTFIADKLKITEESLDKMTDFNKLLEECRREFLQTVINQDQAKILLSLKTTDKKNKVKYPIKTQAILSGVFTELTSRKMGLISEAKNAYAFICKYCEEICSDQLEEIDEEIDEPTE